MNRMSNLSDDQHSSVAPKKTAIPHKGENRLFLFVLSGAVKGVVALWTEDVSGSLSKVMKIAGEEELCYRGFEGSGQAIYSLGVVKGSEKMLELEFGIGKFTRISDEKHDQLMRSVNARSDEITTVNLNPVPTLFVFKSIGPDGDETTTGAMVALVDKTKVPGFLESQNINISKKLVADALHITRVEYEHWLQFHGKEGEMVTSKQTLEYASVRLRIEQDGEFASEFADFAKAAMCETNGRSVMLSFVSPEGGIPIGGCIVSGPTYDNALGLLRYTDWFDKLDNNSFAVAVNCDTDWVNTTEYPMPGNAEFLTVERMKSHGALPAHQLGGEFMSSLMAQNDSASKCEDATALEQALLPPLAHHKKQ